MGGTVERERERGPFPLEVEWVVCLFCLILTEMMNHKILSELSQAASKPAARTDILLLLCFRKVTRNIIKCFRGIYKFK